MATAHGGRVTLEIEGAPGETIVYRATLVVGDATWRGRATVGAGDGGVAFEPWDGPGAPPDWLVKDARAFLRGEWKARREPGHAPWPRRLHRWRGAP